MAIDGRVDDHQRGLWSNRLVFKFVKNIFSSWSARGVLLWALRQVQRPRHGTARAQSGGPVRPVRTAFLPQNGPHDCLAAGATCVSYLNRGPIILQSIP